MQSEGVLRLVTWPAWFLLFSSVVLLFAAFARAFSGEFRQGATHGDQHGGSDRQNNAPGTATPGNGR